MTNKKNKFFTFCFSMIPGAGEMYLGFYKMGLSLMAIFWLSIAFSGFTSIPVALFLIPIVWFYSFFHVHNLNSMPEEEFYALEDDWLIHLNSQNVTPDVWLSKHKRLIAIGLIFFGVSFIWNLISNLLFNFLKLLNLSNEWYYFIRNIGNTIPQTVIGLFIIYAGILLIRGKKEDLDQDQDPIIPSPPYVEYKEIKEAESQNENPAD